MTIVIAILQLHKHRLYQNCKSRTKEGFFEIYAIMYMGQTYKSNKGADT